MTRFLAVALGTLLPASAFAASPNFFLCRADQDRISVSYTKNSFQGHDLFHVRIGGRDAFTSGQGGVHGAVTESATPLGTLVTGTLTRELPDAPALIYSVVIPDIELGPRATRTSFTTVMIMGDSGGLDPLPAVHARIRRTVTLACEAKIVI